jgi:hypothetical protein
MYNVKILLNIFDAMVKNKLTIVKSIVHYGLFKHPAILI